MIVSACWLILVVVIWLGIPGPTGSSHQENYLEKYYTKARTPFIRTSAKRDRKYNEIKYVTDTMTTFPSSIYSLFPEDYNPLTFSVTPIANIYL